MAGLTHPFLHLALASNFLFPLFHVPVFSQRHEYENSHEPFRAFYTSISVLFVLFQVFVSFFTPVFDRFSLYRIDSKPHQPSECEFLLSC